MSQTPTVLLVTGLEASGTKMVEEIAGALPRAASWRDPSERKIIDPIWNSVATIKEAAKDLFLELYRKTAPTPDIIVTRRSIPHYYELPSLIEFSQMVHEMEWPLRVLVIVRDWTVRLMASDVHHENIETRTEWAKVGKAHLREYLKEATRIGMASEMCFFSYEAAVQLGFDYVAHQFGSLGFEFDDVPFPDDWFVDRNAERLAKK